ncbi:MAG: AAA family ATPase [Methanobrevibacter sp.]|nr:AAA family ATPase [Candidatus Methanovirga australis]
MGTQTFEFLRENNYLYIDKTKEIYDLVHNEKIVFLSRRLCKKFGGCNIFSVTLIPFNSLKV